MLELNNVLMATFRFAAGQKSISADDLVVFAEIIYFAFGLRYMLINLYYCLYCSFSWVYSDVRIGSPRDSLLGRHHYAAWVVIWLLVF